MSLIKPANELENPTGQVIRYAFIGRQPLVAATVAVSEAFRSAVLSALHATTGSQDSFLLSGHHADATPDSEHRHAYYLPRPDSTGRIRELAVVSPWNRFSQEELIALKTVQVIQWNGPSTKTRLELLDGDDHSVVQLACRWVSLTPYVPLRRFWGKHGKHHLTPDKQIVTEITRVMPECVVEELKLGPQSNVQVRVASSSSERSANSPACRLAFFVEFRSRHPVCGPLALGHSSHFGLGQFVPVDLKDGKGET
jgi:CRISPR-associated protein Csb2